ncbi:MAG: hypothetical protein MUF52_07790 [Syntrophobacteraceae bacterium]|jgi:hypothetical protein|nr:hypothetical protein [Syntrophobacteraceae bacterium]
MADLGKENREDWDERACRTFSAERREDTVVLVLAAITVVLVWSGMIGTDFFKSLFF